MPSRLVRRRLYKRLAYLQGLTESQRRAKAGQLLWSWREEARQRAPLLSGPAVWDLPAAPKVRAAAAIVDPSGELQSELERVCAEAVGEVAGRHLVRGGHRIVDRSRRTR